MQNLRTVTDWPGDVPAVPALAAPLTGADALQGVLIVTQPVGQVSGEEDAVLLSTFAGQAVLALERARAQEERQQLAVLEDRERIARDLHDVVIQRLFATGMQLQATVHQVTRPDATKRINAAVDDLDVTIRDIRRSIFELRTQAGPSLRSEIREVVEVAVESLGFRPVLDTIGPLDSAVPDVVVPDLLAALRELLSDVAWHAQASRARVSVTASADEIVLCVEDDGAGTDPAKARGGLIDVHQRAEALGGAFELGPGPGGAGTVVTWRVPVTG